MQREEQGSTGKTRPPGIARAAIAYSSNQTLHVVAGFVTQAKFLLLQQLVFLLGHEQHNGTPPRRL